MKIGVLALQGAFAEHEKVLEQLGAECIDLRQARDLAEPYDALVPAPRPCGAPAWNRR